MRRKLVRVLWIPLLCGDVLSIGDRRIGSPLLWSPGPEEEAALRADWEEFMELICVGRIDEISAHFGTCLQIRPKAASARSRRRAVGAEGTPVRTLPRGFYLRTGFTVAILESGYLGQLDSTQYLPCATRPTAGYPDAAAPLAVPCGVYTHRTASISSGATPVRLIKKID